MSVQVRYFASIRESLGGGESVYFVVGETVVDLRRRLQSRSSAHAEALGDGKALRCALNQTLCDADALVPDGAEVAFFPPVTGG